MGQLSTAAFTAYNAANAASITAGPLALYSVSLDSLMPTQINEGFAEVDTKQAGFDDLTSLAAVEANLLTAIEPVVIGPGGVLYLLDGHHTLTALAESVWGASNPTVYVNVIANYSNLTTSQFWSTLEANNLVLPLNNGVSETLNTATGAPIPTNLTSLISDPYRGLEYSILKNKSSTLFTTTSNLTGAVGASTPGLDKLTGFYADFIWGQAYQEALGGLGLPYLSPGDIALATAWNLNLNNTTVEPIVGTVKVGQLPGAVLGTNIAISSTISNATLATGTLDAFGTFTGITSFTFGATTLGTVQSGLVLQDGADTGHTVTLTGTNTYTGGTTFIAGTLIIGSDAALGAAAPSTYTINPNNIAASVRAANGLVFNSLTEGNAILTIGTTAGGGTATFITNRPIAVDGEIATLNPDGYLVTLTGQIVSLGSDGTGIGNATGISDFTVNDTSSGAKGVVTIAPSTGSNSQFYGNWIVTAGTLSVASDAALGSTTLPAAELGQIDLNGGTFQTSGNFTSSRALFLAGGSSFDTDGHTTSFGAVTDVQRTLTVLNSSTTSAGAVTFSAFNAASTAILALTSSTKGLTVTLTNGFVRSGAATVMVSTTGTLGSITLKLLAGTAPTLIDGIVSPWIVSDNGGSATVDPYNFMTYGANGYVNATYSKTGGGTTGGLAVATSSDVVDQTLNATLAANAEAYALNINNGVTVTLGTHTLTLGDGTDPAGLILQNAAISGGTLAFGGSEGVIWIKGSTGQTVSSVISGSGGLTFAGSGGVTLNAQSTETGAINVDSGTLTLGVANVFANDAAGLTLLDVKSKPSNAILAFSTNQAFSTLNSAGNNSAITMSGGAVLTIGDSNNLSSTLSSGITQTGAAVSGAIVKAGSGLLDLSGMSKTTLTLVSGSTIAVQGGQLRIAATALANATGFAVSGGAELQFAEKAGDIYAGAVTGAGDVRLLTGTLKLTGTSNTYSGGTFVETGATLDLTTANVSSGNANIGDAGGIVDFDQNTNGTYAGVISDARLLGTGTLEAGTLVKDDSTTDGTGVLTLTQVQAFSGGTYIEAGSIDLAAANALQSSSGVVLGRIGGGATASLILDNVEQLASLSSDAGNTTSVVLNNHTLTLAPVAGADATFGGVISNGGAQIGSGAGLVIDGAGTVTLTGANTFASGVIVEAGTLELGNASAAGSGAIAFAAGDSATLKIDAGLTIGNVVAGFATGDTIDLAGLALANGGSATLGAGNVLSVTEGTTTEQIQLDPTASFAGSTFRMSSDGNGGTDVTLIAAPTLTVDGNGTTVNAAGEGSVAFTISGLRTGDTGTVTFTDSLDDTVVAQVTAGQSAYTANFAGLADGPITSSLTIAGQSYTATGNVVALHATLPSAPIGLADTAIANGYVNGATDLASQALTGTATAGDTITVYDAGMALLGSTTVGSDGTWSYTLGTLGDGLHSLTATATDSYGNVSTTSGALGFVVDTVNPDAPLTLADAASSNGVVNAAADTDAQTLTGTATAGDTVTVYDGKALLGSTTVGSDGTWSYALGTLDDGQYRLTATDTSGDGNVSAASAALVLTVDTALPAAPTALVDGNALNGVVNLADDTDAQMLTGTATAGDTVTIYDGTSLLGTTTVGADGTWSYTLGTLDNGQHSLTATDTNPDGNTGTASDALVLNVDTSVPAAPTALSDANAVDNAAGAVVNIAGDIATQALTGMATAGDTVTICDGTTLLGTTTVGADGTWSYTLGTLGNGQHTLTATDTNADGNVSAASTALALNVDTNVPAAPTALADANAVGGVVNLVNDSATQALTGSATAGDTVSIYDNGVLLGAVVAGSDGTWTYTLGKLANGPATLTAIDTNADGNASTSSAALTLTVDTTVPSAPYPLVDSSAVGGVVNLAHDSATQTLTGVAAAGSSIAVYDNGALIGFTTSDSNGAWTYTLGTLAGGTNSLTATAANADGNVSAMSKALVVTVDTTLPTAPMQLVDAEASGGVVNFAHDVAWQQLDGTATAGELITIYDNGTLLGTARASATGAWGYKIGVLANGTNSLTATATSSDGNVSATSTALVLNVDTVIPATPGAPVDTAASNGVVNLAHDTASQALTGTGAAGDTISVYDDYVLRGTTTVGADGTWTYTIGTLASGSASFTAIDTSPDGNASAMSAAVVVKVDTTVPTAPATLVDASAVVGVVNLARDSATQTLTGVAAAGGSIAVYDNGMLLGTTTSGSNGVWTYTLGTLAGGTNSLTATAANADGNVSAISKALVVTVDTTLPAEPTQLADAQASGGVVNFAHDVAWQVLTGTATAGELVTIYDNGTLLGTARAGATGAWAYKTGVLANGTNSLTATAISSDGNVSAASAALVLNVDTNVPAAPGALTDTVASNGVVNLAHDTAAQALTGTGAAGDTISVYDNHVLRGTTTVGADGTWTYTLGTLANGSASFTAIDTNADGNVSATSTALVVKVDTVVQAAPYGLADAAAVRGVVNLASDTAAQTLTGTGVAGDLVTITDNGLVVGTATVAGNGTWSDVIGVLADGSYSLAATQANADGNVSVASSALVLNVDTVVPPPPAALSDAMATNGSVNLAHDVAWQELTGTATAGNTITVYDNGAKLGTATVGSNGTWSYRIGVLANGTQSYTATATSSSGNVSAISGALTLTVDTTVPLPVITGETLSTDATMITLSGTDAEVGASVAISDNGTLAGTATVAADGTWSETVAVTAGVKNVYTAAGSDFAGNGAKAASMVVIDTVAKAGISVPPGAAIVLGLPGDIISAGTGPDTFVFHAGFGTESISGFTTSGASADILQFDKSLFADWAHLLGATTQVGANLEITLDPSDIITLKNVTLASFTSSSAHFV